MNSSAICCLLESHRGAPVHRCDRVDHLHVCSQGEGMLPVADMGRTCSRPPCGRDRGVSLQFQQQFPGTDRADAMVTKDDTIPGVTYMPDATDGMDSIGI